jgi:hypothetical protein
LKDAMVDRARDGKPHTGQRRYGYSKDGMTIIEEEAVIVRWVFESFLDGMTPNAIAEISTSVAFRRSGPNAT